MGTEHREAARWRGRLRSAKLFDAAKRFLVTCRVVDISATGARLQPENDRPLPMDLNYRADDDEYFRPASLIWVRQSQIGIQFAQPDAPEAPAVDGGACPTPPTASSTA